VEAAVHKIGTLTAGQFGTCGTAMDAVGGIHISGVLLGLGISASLAAHPWRAPGRARAGASGSRRRH
jgi:hypothetical protein